MNQQEAVTQAAEALRHRLEGRAPEVAIVLGSGLGFLADRLDNAARVPYPEIPGFPYPTVAGHAGELVCGQLEGKTVLAQSGRFHLYEGHEAAAVALPVRVFATLGASVLVVTNAAGGINRSLAPGTLMLIRDHINLTGRNPLVGARLDGEERFPDMTEAYDPALRELARRSAREAGIELAEGVYAALLGPSYETPAEIAMLERLGADAVGMSTVHEVITARARRMRCVGISTITNAAAGYSGRPLAHQEVLEIAERSREHLAALVRGIVRGC